MMEHGRRTRNHKLQRGPGGVPSLVTPLPHGQTLLCTPHPGFCFSKAGRTPKGAFFPPISASHSHGGRAGLSSPSPAPAWVILMDPRSTTRFIIPWGGNAPSIPIPPPCANASRFGSIRPRFLQGGFDTPCQRHVHRPRELSLLLFLWLIRPTKPCLKKNKCLFGFGFGSNNHKSSSGEDSLAEMRPAGLPPVPQDRANFICHPRLLLKPLGGLIILKVKVKVIHAYFFPKWITPV